MARQTAFTGEQITFARRQAEAGLPVEDVCRKLGIRPATFFRWKPRYGQIGTAEVRRRGNWRRTTRTSSTSSPA